MTITITWTRTLGHFGAPTDSAKVGKWTVGNVQYRMSVAKDDSRKYEANVRLPGLKSTQGYFETEDEAKAKVETAINHWFKNIS